MDLRIEIQLLIYFLIGLACAKQLSYDINQAMIKFKNNSALTDYDKYLISLKRIQDGCSISKRYLFILGLYVLTVVLCPVWFIIKLRNI